VEANETSTTGALVWRLTMRWRAAVDRAVGPFGLTHAQFSALASLRQLTGLGEEPSQRRLAEFTGLGPIYVSKLVRSLERAGMVIRSPDPSDGRAVLLTLTSEGVDVIDRAAVVVRALNDELTSPLGAPGSAELQAFRSALQTLLDAAPRGVPLPESDIPTGDEP
jgi:DNA-binding MarR family transcriptional regulator